MEARMSVCNMTIEAGARAGMVAPDETTFAYIKGRPLAPKGSEWDKAVAYWKTLKTDPCAKFDKEVVIDAADIAPCVTWGTSPEEVVQITGCAPDPEKAGPPGSAKRNDMERALKYMGLTPNMKMQDVTIQKVFIGSCTNSRIEDMRAAAAVAQGRQVAEGIHAMVVPGSGMVKMQADAEGLSKVFIEAGFDWRESGCSMCLAMNTDKLKPQERCASTSNRNFEGRQGPQGRTHLMSPIMAAAAAVTGTLTDVRDLLGYVENGSFEAPPEATPTVDAFFADATASTGPQINADATAGGGDGDAAGGGGMTPFVTLTGLAAPLDIQNIDTDMIIPKEFLKTIKRSGLGFAAFAELRYENPDVVATAGTPDVAVNRADFVLNQAPWQGAANILVAGDNFGCGSSREHAPWSINDMGIRSIISTSFADIFYNNCFKNGMLPIILPRDAVEDLLDAAAKCEQLTVDLPSQTVSRADGTGATYSFDVDPFRKNNLLKGLDDIGLTIANNADDIAKFEDKRSRVWPWLDGATTRVPDNMPVPLAASAQELQASR